MSLNTKSGDMYISFNQTEKYACFGTPIGFYIYSINPFKKILSRKIEQGISIVKMLYESNIVLFVGRTDKGLYPNNKLIIWDDSKKAVLGEISYNNKINNICVNKEHIVVLLEKKIYIYTFETLYLKKSIEINSYTNTNNLVCIGLEKSDYLVYPGNVVGSVNITKLSSDYLETIQAHTNNIENIYLSTNGKYLVTASDKGTLIRIFDVETKEKKNELRRGADPTKINDLRFNHDNSILLVSSIKGTIHLYNTNLVSDFKTENPTFENYGISLVKGILPEYFHSRWSFTQFHIPEIKTYSIFDKTKQIIYSFGSDGQYYILDFHDKSKPTIERTIRYISDESDPFSERSSTIK